MCGAVVSASPRPPYARRLNVSATRRAASRDSAQCSALGLDNVGSFSPSSAAPGAAREPGSGPGSAQPSSSAAALEAAPPSSLPLDSPVAVTRHRKAKSPAVRGGKARPRRGAPASADSGQEAAVSAALAALPPSPADSLSSAVTATAASSGSSALVVPGGPISDAYFAFYADIRIHDTMLRDTSRTATYARALLRSPDLLRGRTVLDVGCGTGILSMLAAKAGAAHVYGVEASSMAVKARQIVRENGLQDQITIIQGRIEDVELPVAKVDIIVSEWMGYCLLFESMLPSVLHARDKWLAPGGAMLPGSATLHITGVGVDGNDGTGLGSGSAGSALADHKRAKVDFWNDVYGFRMTALREPALALAYHESMDARTVVTSSATVLDWDLASVPAISVGAFSSPFTLTAAKDCEVVALMTHFDVGFSGGRRPLVLSTSPSADPTHWQQTVLYLKEDVAMRKGERLTGRIEVRRSAVDGRALELQVEWLHRGALSKSKGNQIFTLC